MIRACNAPPYPSGQFAWSATAEVDDTLQPAVDTIYGEYTQECSDRQITPLEEPAFLSNVGSVLLLRILTEACLGRICIPGTTFIVHVPSPALLASPFTAPAVAPTVQTGAFVAIVPPIH
jgi:hypothetical protein